MSAPECLQAVLPPHSIEAEQDVLGALLIGGDAAWDDVASLLSDADFYRDDHRRIFRMIRSLHESAHPVDVLTVADALAASNEKSQTGGLAYLGELANSVASVAHARRRAVVIRDKALRRQLMTVGQEIERLAQTAESASVATEQAQRMVLDADQSGTRGSEPRHISEVVGRAIGEIDARMDAGEVFGTPTGFADLDRLTAGLHAGDLVIVAGRPAMGKTAWALNVAENVAMAGKTVLVFSLEMGDTQLAMRSLASVGGASLSKVRSGAMEDHEWDAITAAMGKLHAAKLYIDDAAGSTAGQMLAKARKLKRQHGLDLIVIDYLQLMQGEGNNRNEQLTVNFNRKGANTPHIAAFYAFFNAAVQGTARMSETLASPAGKKIMAGGVAVGFMSSALAMLAMGAGGDDDDLYAAIPEFVKQTSLIIPTGGKSYITIPFPLGFRFLPNIGRLAAEAMFYKSKRSAVERTGSMLGILADSFNPFGGNAPAAQMAAPTVLDPVVALLQNKDWTGKSIYKEDFNGLDPTPGFDRYKTSATPTSKMAAEAINTLTGGTEYTPGKWSPTPDQLDYVVGTLTGGVGRELGKLVTTVAAPFTGDELPSHKIPLVSRFYGSVTGSAGQSERFYENLIKAHGLKREMKGMAEDRKPLEKFHQDNPNAMDMMREAARGDGKVTALRKTRERQKETGDKEGMRDTNERITQAMKEMNNGFARLQ
ncbi:MAG: AAA family ATPase [Sterolibacterium sp.]|jgi:replicative DNA helicase|nr:AAA family ATPase [Sterolibacterium sp.]